MIFSPPLPGLKVPGIERDAHLLPGAKVPGSAGGGQDWVEYL